MKTTRGLWLAIMSIAAFVIGVTGGLLWYAAHKDVSEAVMTAAGAFAGSMMLMMAMMHFASGTE